MNVKKALQMAGIRIRTLKYNAHGDLPANKNNPYIAHMDEGYMDIQTMRSLGEAYIIIANHIEKLNHALK